MTRGDRKSAIEVEAFKSSGPSDSPKGGYDVISIIEADRRRAVAWDKMTDHLVLVLKAIKNNERRNKLQSILVYIAVTIIVVCTVWFTYRANSLWVSVMEERDSTMQLRATVEASTTAQRASALAQAKAIDATVTNDTAEIVEARHAAAKAVVVTLEAEKDIAQVKQDPAVLESIEGQLRKAREKEVFIGKAVSMSKD